MSIDKTRFAFFVLFAAGLVALPLLRSDAVTPQPTPVNNAANNNAASKSSGNVNSGSVDAKSDSAESKRDTESKTEKGQADDGTSRPKIKPRRSSAASRAKGEINFDDLVFDIEKDAPFKPEMITKDIKELVNKKVKLRGYILPSTLFRETNIDRFVLVRDNQECCFGPGAALFDCVIVEMVPGKTTDFVTRPVTVTGKFEIDTKTYKYPGGTSPSGASHMAIFRIKGEAVK